MALMTTRAMAAWCDSPVWMTAMLSAWCEIACAHVCNIAWSASSGNDEQREESRSREDRCCRASLAWREVCGRIQRSVNDALCTLLALQAARGHDVQNIDTRREWWRRLQGEPAGSWRW